MIAVFSGLLAGALHVLSGPDHLAAIAPLTVANWKRSLTIGFRWGLGHASGVIFVGLLALVFREVLPIDSISSYAERSVGVILIGLGIWSFRRALKTHLHTHSHTHDGSTHVHVHVHGHGHSPHAASVPAHQHTHTAFGVGTIHGVAGSSHLFAVVPALVFASRFDSIVYLVCYGVGTVVAMIGFSAGIGALSARCFNYSPRGYQLLTYSCSIAACLVGAYWLVVP